MGKVILDMAISVDGYIAGENDDDGGLHAYFFSPTPATAEVIEDGFRTTGAIIMGRRTYDIGAAQDGFADNPYSVPTFVVTHRVPAARATGAEAFVFVTDGVESAVRQAQAAAGERDIVVGGGAQIAQACIEAGLLDEIHLHLIPMLLGKGIRLFSGSGGGQAALESTRVVHAPDATHLRFRVVQ